MLNRKSPSSSNDLVEMKRFMDSEFKQLADDRNNFCQAAIRLAKEREVLRQQVEDLNQQMLNQKIGRVLKSRERLLSTIQRLVLPVCFDGDEQRVLIILYFRRNPSSSCATTHHMDNPEKDDYDESMSEQDVEGDENTSESIQTVEEGHEQATAAPPPPLPTFNVPHPCHEQHAHDDEIEPLRSSLKSSVNKRSAKYFFSTPGDSQLASFKADFSSVKKVHNMH